jgi:hypothetical protein
MNDEEKFLIEQGTDKLVGTQKLLGVIRFSLFLCLFASLGFYVYESMSLIEVSSNRFMSEVSTIVGSAFKVLIQQSMLKTKRTLESLSTVLSMQCPTDDLYPNCSYPFAHFVKLVSPLVTNGDMRAMGFAPFVRADQVSSFESYAYSIYETQGFPAIGIHKFGKGIMAVDSRSGVEHHDTTGSVLGKRSMLVPVLEAAPIKSNNRSFMYNLYSEASRVAAIDRMLDCFETNSDGDGAACTSVTSVVQLVQDSGELLRPAVLMFRPVVVPLESRNNSVTGLVYAAFNWDNLLQSSVPVSVPAVDIVLLANEQEFTYR